MLNLLPVVDAQTFENAIKEYESAMTDCESCDVFSRLIQLCRSTAPENPVLLGGMMGKATSNPLTPNFIRAVFLEGVYTTYQALKKQAEYDLQKGNG
jgi:hypothetical protein